MGVYSNHFQVDVCWQPSSGSVSCVIHTLHCLLVHIVSIEHLGNTEHGLEMCGLNDKQISRIFNR
jgi:hypothetical protein